MPASLPGHRSPFGWGGPLQFPSSPSKRSEPSTPGSSSGLLSRFFTPSVAFALMDRARLSLVRTGGTLSTPQASLNATDRSFAPPKGLSTLGFDPARFQAKPPT